MSISYNLVSLIDFLGLVQGILLGILLILGSKENRPSFLLGCYLIFFSGDLLLAILVDTQITAQYPSLLFLPFSFYYLTGPTLYLYVKSLTQKFSLQKDFWFLIPGIVEFSFFFIICLFPESTKLQLSTSKAWLNFYIIYTYGSLFFSIYFFIKIIHYINRHQKAVLDFYSNAQGRLLKWIKIVAWFLIFYLSTWLLTIFIPEDHKYYQLIYGILSAINVVFIFWIGLYGFLQRKIMLPAKSTNNSTELKIQSPADSEVQKKFEFLQNYLQEQKPYKNPQLHLKNLAKQLHFSQRALSTLIREQSNMNFNQFINHYRVLEAKKLLVDPKFTHLNMLGIAYEVGFNSKATFYAVFKKNTQTTPSKFQKQALLSR